MVGYKKVCLELLKVVEYTKGIWGIGKIVGYRKGSY